MTEIECEWAKITGSGWKRMEVDRSGWQHGLVKPIEKGALTYLGKIELLNNN